MLMALTKLTSISKTVAKKLETTFTGLSDLVAAVAAAPSVYVVGDDVSTTSYRTQSECDALSITYPDGGGAEYVLVTSGTGTPDGGSFIDAGSRQLKLIIVGYTNPANWGVVLGSPAHDDTTYFQACLNYGITTKLGVGVLTLTDQVHTTSVGQHILGSGRVEIHNKVLVGTGTRILVPEGTVIPKTIKTRRLARTTAADPDDAPISCLINLYHVGNKVEDLSIELFCDYSDTSHTNLGADCDVAVFNECREEPKFYNLSILGYFRKAGIYLDVTRGVNLPDYSSGLISTDATGCDRAHVHGVEIDGSFKDFFLAGPLLNGSSTYYDTTLGMSVSEARGGSGASDLLIDGNFFFHGRNHHSSRRGYDPLMDPDAENIDQITASIAIDSRRGSASQGRTRRITIRNGRITSFEAARIFFDRAYEVNIDDVHTEPGSLSYTRYDTLGNVINPSDTVNQTYGPIACKSTSGTQEGTNVVAAWNVRGTGIVGAWTTTLVTDFTHTRKYINPQFNVTFDGDVTAGDDVIAVGQLSGNTLDLYTADTTFTPVLGFITAPTYTVQVGKHTVIAGMCFMDIVLTYSGLNTADTSSLSILALPESLASQSGFIASIDDGASTGLVDPHTMKFNSNGSSTQIGLFKDGLPVKYNSGNINSSGTIVLSVSYRT
jgi:hypothetical protein